MLVHAAAIVRLKCSFHCFIICLFCCYSPIKHGSTPHFGLQNYTFLFNYTSFSQKIMNYELRIKNYFVPLHPKITKYIFYIFI